jgi:hypothetical protein
MLDSLEDCHKGASPSLDPVPAAVSYGLLAGTMLDSLEDCHKGASASLDLVPAAGIYGPMSGTVLDDCHKEASPLTSESVISFSPLLIPRMFPLNSRDNT